MFFIFFGYRAPASQAQARRHWPEPPKHPITMQRRGDEDDNCRTTDHSCHPQSESPPEDRPRTSSLLPPPLRSPMQANPQVAHTRSPLEAIPVTAPATALSWQKCRGAYPHSNEAPLQGQPRRPTPQKTCCRGFKFGLWCPLQNAVSPPQVTQ